MRTLSPTKDKGEDFESYESVVLMITMMITKDDDKDDDKKLKDQSKNNSSESRTIQEFKIRIKKNSRLKKKV